MRRRADAQRNVADILEAAERVLVQHPEASMDEVARAAGVTRQTVYAHFRSRDALLSALLQQLTQRVTAVLDAADLESGPAAEAVVRFLEAAWHASLAEPLLVYLAQQPRSPQQDSDLHEPMTIRLHALIQRGQDGGEFDPEPPATWLVATTIALAHTAGEEVRAGRMTADEAIDALRRTIPRALAP
ncbi:TetR/AcrR family transcriptional regulator [Kitasatospora acidiphila]|uniref:TetR/AcrR family transcriptional regulator n=1 Tax=Kitasatospora acidiphila TaxID=2567942 RepID=A0A540VWQ3_9ACTN|nr:TetR/AcrR family transcriptional regulator [Kitasatospora acidiphila]TQF01200.1 TetR/AcrR family transcriptional regulator [Kitasatospora acidiphila]